MKNNIIGINFYKVIWPIALVLELFLTYFTYWHVSHGLSLVIALLTIPPTFFFFIKEIIDGELTMPDPIVFIYQGFALEMGIAPLRGYIAGMRVTSICGFAICLIASYFIIRKNKDTTKSWVVMLYLLAGLSSIELPIRIYDFTGTLLSLPDFLTHALGIVAGLFLYHREKIFQKINLSISILLVLFVYFYGYDLWMNKVDFGSFNGKVYVKAPSDFHLTDNNNAIIHPLKGKITVLDFWFVNCSSCFATFPEFQKAYDKYKNNTNVQLYTANQPPSGTNIMDSFKMLTQRGYTFPMATASYDKTLAKSLDIRVYPTTVVIDGQGFVIYKGDIKGAMETVNDLLQNGSPAAE